MSRGAAQPWVLRVELRPSASTPSPLPGLSAVDGGLAVCVGGHLDDATPRTVLDAYRRAGETSLEALRGSFIVAIIDESNDVTIVARDPIGTYPVYYVEREGTLTFADSIWALVPEAGPERRFNRAALADHLCYRWPDKHETFFAEVRRVPPGWRAKVTKGRLDLARYWSPAPPGRAVSWITGDATTLFDAGFDGAIDRCLDGGPAAVFLSGGLDSISVAAVAADRATRRGLPPPRAYSVAFPDPTCDERQIQRSVAASLGMPQRLDEFRATIGARGLLAASLELNQHLAAPLLNTWAPAYLGLARHAREDHVATILSGTGGDEWLTVSPLLSADLLRAGDVAGLARFMGTARRSFGTSPARLLQTLAWTFGLRPLASQLLSRLAPGPWQRRRVRRQTRRDPSWLAPARDVRTEVAARAAANMPTADPPDGFYLEELRTSLDHPLVAWELEEHVDFGRLIGVRFMQPYWDADLVDMLFRTPPALLLQGGRTKGLVRETLAKRFPTLGFERQVKVEATSFYRSILDTEAPALVDAVEGFPALDALGVVDGRAATAFARRALAERRHERYRVWALLNLEAWVRAHG